MKKQSILIFAALLIFAPLFAQDPAQDQQNQQVQDQQDQQVQDQQNQQADQGSLPAESNEEGSNLAVIDNDPEAENTGSSKVAGEELQTLLLDDFDVPQGWQASIPLDYGLSRVLYRDGAPQDVASDANKMVLGVKTIFFRRNYGWQSVDRPYPIVLRSIVKNFSLWAVGRNRNHTLSVKVRDLDGNLMRLKSGLGEMRWRGWKKVIIPVTNPVVQQRPQYSRKGLEFLGFHIDMNAADIATAEPSYFYFDYLTATVNLAGSQMGDDMSDNW